MLRLVKPSPKYVPVFLRALDEYKSDTAEFGLDSIRAIINLVETGKFGEWLAKTKNANLGINLPKGYVSNTKY